MTRVVRPAEVLVANSPWAEGPAFDKEGNLHFVNWDASAITRLTPEGELSEVFNTGGIPAGLAFAPDGSLWIADEGEHIHGLLRVDLETKTSEIVVNAFEGMPLNGANDLVFGADGTVYFSDPWQTSLENPTGGFYRYLPNGTLDKIDDGLAFPNGVAIDPAGAYVYLAETQRNRILRYAINPDGSMGEREHWADTPLPTGPDGMAFAANGELYSARFNGHGVDVYAPDGSLQEHIDIPGAKTTNCCFGGPNNSTLYVTDVDTEALYTVELSVSGLPLNDGRNYN
ncbi:MAG: SMP-30/gluconolactonase/LRE family protein [Thermomicrobiales bacterium]|nr:SMP-30/gluconolactonase/LRE family protein [Thermomicrobiales bacterium]